MNRKQKKELRRRLSTRQLMGIDQLTEHGLKTAKGELVFYLISPDNLSVLSAEGVRGRVRAMTDLLRGTESAELLALDSRESFQSNKHHYQDRLEREDLPALREMLRQDTEHLDEIQASVFGTHVLGASDRWLNIYADYEMATGSVCDALSLRIYYEDGREESLEYRLNAIEKATLLRKMDAYCLQQTGQSLKDYSAGLMAEEEIAPPAGPAL